MLLFVRRRSRGIGKPRTNLIGRQMKVNLNRAAGSRSLLDGLARQDQLGDLLDPTVQVLHGIALVHLLSNDHRRDEEV